jgi:hypothetical protein
MGEVFLIIYEDQAYTYKKTNSIETTCHPNVIAVAFTKKDAIKISDFYNDDMAYNG